MSNKSHDGRAAAGDFASFLDSVPAALRESVGAVGGPGEVRVTLGNEAGDADSIVSALALGYVQSLESPPSGRRVVAPVVSVPRVDLALRRDVSVLLDLAGIDARGMLYLDDDVVARHLLPPADKEPPSTLSTALVALTLVDHNRIRPSLSHLSPAVVEIVDHHEDESFHGGVTADSNRRVIAFEGGHATVASTCTLVVERLFRTNAISGGGSIDRGLGLALLGVILLDSVDMLPAAGKGTPRDAEAIRLLLEHTDWASSGGTAPSLVDAATLEKIFPAGGGGTPDRRALFEALSGAKNDRGFWQGLSVVDCLRIDYKKFQVSPSGRPNPSAVSTIGLSSLLIDLESLLAKRNFMEGLGAFAESCAVDLLGIMALDLRDGAPQRELLLAGADAGVVESFAGHLKGHPDAAFLEIVERGRSPDANGGMTIRTFRQGNGRASRKQVAPILLRHAAAMSR